MHKREIPIDVEAVITALYKLYISNEINTAELINHVRECAQALKSNIEQKTLRDFLKQTGVIFNTCGNEQSQLLLIDFLYESLEIGEINTFKMLVTKSPRSILTPMRRNAILASLK